jgi:tight adherence protein C
VIAVGVALLWALVVAAWAGERVHRATVRSRPGSQTSAPPGRARGRWSPSPRVRRLVIVGSVAALLTVVHPLLAPAAVLGAVAAPRLRARRDRRQAEEAVVDELPDVVDLLGLTTAAGLPVTAAVRAIAGRPGGHIGRALADAAACLDRGGAAADALAVLADRCGPPLRRLGDALADHDRYGTPLGPILDRVGVEARLARRRHAEQAAQRLPVALLFPLVLTVLPAFVLLVVVPLLAGSLAALEL